MTATVVVDGVTYAPATDAAPRIGVAVTTRNRPQILADTLRRIRRHTPPGVPVYVVDDASTPPVDDADHRFATQAGIPAAKNKCLELLVDAGVDHLFLFDDDCYPCDDGWWKPYVASPEPHLAFQFADLSGPRKLGDLAEIYRDNAHVAYTGQRGVMLYYHRSAIEAVGGFDPAYGIGMYEHSDLANRIYHAGLTTWRYADIVGSEKLIYSLDEHGEVDRTLTDDRRRQQVDANAEIHHSRRDSGYVDYVAYRPAADAVITTLLTSNPDPQRRRQWKPDPATLAAWARSLRDETAIVLADELDELDGATVVGVPASKMNLYAQRWLHIYRHLRAHPEYHYVWCTDGSDVVLLRPPWQDMRPDAVYVGSEPKTLGDTWMRTNHPAQRYQQFIEANRNRTLLNAGLLGGARDVVLDFAHRMIREHDDLAAHRFWGTETSKAEIGDMAAFNRVAYLHYNRQLVTGPRVHTVFRADEQDNQWAWWKHR